jgi:signal transduction histidine kinase
LAYDEPVVCSTKDAVLTSPPEGPETTARRTFLRAFFHDLATPLSAVSLHLEGANRRILRGDDPSESLGIARTELARAFDLFEQGRELLLARPSNRETFPFDDWVEAATRDLSNDGVRVEGRTDGKIAGDRSKLSEALSALLVNALESSSPVSIARERRDGRLSVRIENSGVLPSDDPEKLFSPRTAGAGKNWGMGLARARLYAADAGGAVRLTQDGDRVVAVLELPEAPA